MPPKANTKAVIKLSDKDFEQKTFKALPGGKHHFIISPKSEIRSGNAGPYINVALQVKKGPHKGTFVWDTVSAAVGWKIAQLALALGIPKAKLVKGLSLEQLLKLIVGKEVIVIVTKTTYEGQPQNKVKQYLPLAAESDDDDDTEDDEDEDEEDSDDEDDTDEDDDDEDSDEEDDDESDDDEDEEEDDEEEDDEDEDEDDDSDDDDDADDDEDEDSDDDDEDDEDEDEEPAKPVKKAAGKKAPAKPAPAPAKASKPAKPAPKAAKATKAAPPAKPAKKGRK
jgi:hypothetical protein